VLNLRTEQFIALQDHIDRQFAPELRALFRRTKPNAMTGRTDEQLDQDMLGALKRARAYGIEQKADLVSFVTLLVSVSPRFDEHPAVAAVLADSRSGAEKIAAITAQMCTPIRTEAQLVGT